MKIFSFWGEIFYIFEKTCNEEKYQYFLVKKKQHLTLRCLYCSYGGFHSKIQNEPQQIYITLQGLLMMSSYCFISGLAAVYTEYILKKQLTVS